MAMLQSAGCAATFADVVMPGATYVSIGLAAARAFVRPGDTLVIWRLDRLARTLPQLVDLIEDLHSRRIGFKSLTESVDTTDGGEQPVASLFVALANVQRNLHHERTLIAREAARADGRRGGRPRSLTGPQVALAQALYDDPANRIDDICRMLQVSQNTLYRNVKSGPRRLWARRPG
jgi:DNA invertase Pin-like site-specific DNA recombinase